VATIEVAVISGGANMTCSTGSFLGPVDCSGVGGPIYNVCGTYDADNDFSVNILDFCTTGDCVTAAQTTLPNTQAVPVPMSAATDGRDHWLAPGEPHCADCHAAPYVEQSGNINAYPPFNYPRKASLMRYSKGHQGITCQGCHESIHGLYPVTPTIDTTTYAQAANLNNDDSHGPIKCAACHDSNASGVNGAAKISYNGVDIEHDFDAAVSWMHTYTDEADPRVNICQRCHTDNSAQVSSTNPKWVAHAKLGKVSRKTMDKVENLTMGHVAGDPDEENPYTTLCVNCHTDKSNKVSCSGSSGKRWKKHMVEGRASEKVWTYVSNDKAGSTCGW
jgi:cytochrome c553